MINGACFFWGEGCLLASVNPITTLSLEGYISDLEPLFAKQSTVLEVKTQARRGLILKPYPNIVFIFFKRLKPGATLFEKLPPRVSTLRRGVKPSCSCVKKGNRRFNTCDVKPLPEIERGGKPVKPIKVPPRPRKPGRNDNRDYDPGSVNYVFKPPKVKYRKPSFPTATGITRQKALDHCKKTLRQSSVARACSKLVRKKEASLIKECMTDIMVRRSYDMFS